jgi:serine protease 16
MANYSLFCGLVLLLAVYSMVLTTASASIDRKLIGFGAQRMKKNEGAKKQVTAAADCGSSVEYYFSDAVVDNFAPINAQQKWAGKGQRYWVNNEFFAGKGSPILVFIGGEGQETCTRLGPRMYAYNLAQEHHALMVNVEHRFYGESYPTAGMSTSELQYLSSAQALADLARVIDNVKKTNGLEDSKVITIGGSYPGNLAGWFRLKYPSVTHGSIASSAPVFAKTNFYEYMDVVADAIKYFSGQSCYNAFESAANTVASLAAQGFGSAGMQQLEKDFATCSSINTAQDLAVLYSDLMGNVQGTVQYNNEHLGVMNVTDICSTMLASGDPYAQFVALSAQFRKANGQECEDANWADMTAYLSASAKDPTNAGRPWTYQTCNEFGYFQTTDSKVGGCGIS